MAGIDLSLEKASQFFGCDPRTIHRWLRDGCPGQKSVKGAWSLNSAAVSDWLRSRERDSALGEVASVNEAEARRRLRVAEARIKEIEAVRAEGSVITVEDHGRMMDTAYGNFRAKALNFGSKTAPIVVTCDSAAEVKDVIDTEMRQLLQEFSSGEFIPQPSVSTDECIPEGTEGSEDPGAASGSDRKRVGGRKSASKSRGKR